MSKEISKEDQSYGHESAWHAEKPADSPLPDPEIRDVWENE
jgi:hypothetical protein